MNPFTTFAYSPENLPSIFFETQQKDEQVKLFIRPHFIINIPWIIMIIVLLLLPFPFMISGFDTVSYLGLTEFVALFSPLEWVVLIFLYYQAILFYGFLKFLSWYFHVLIVTNQRVMDFNFNIPFSVQTTQAQLQEVQDVRHTQNGVFATVFDFGNLFIQTAGTRQNVYLDYIPNPHRAHDAIVQLLP